MTYPNGSSVEQEDKLLKAAAEAFPMVTTVPVKEAIEAVAKVVANLALGIRGASLVTLVAAVLVLGGALAAGRRNRVYDAVILKTLGATRGAAAWRLWPGISRARARHRGVRRGGRLHRGLAGRHQSDESELRLAARLSRRGGRRRPDRDGGAWA